MEEDVRMKLDALEKKIDATYMAAEKTRKYIFGMLIVTIVTLVLPAVGLIFAVPALLSTYATLGSM